MSRMLRGAILAVFLMTACGEGAPSPPTDSVADGTSDTPSDGVRTEVVAPTAWRDDVVVVDLVTTASQSSTLADGQALEMGWSHQPETYCFNVIEAQAYFSGPVVLFALANPMPKLSTLTVSAVPEPDVDVNLFAYQLRSTEYHLPPTLETLVGCEASFDPTVIANPGVAESLSLNALNDAYNVVIGVAGADEASVGAFTIQLELEGGIPQP